ncbi:MAG: sulfotransferase [Pirellulales bacterium]|nr:sulfotransferase [Pirellulales bacterium]
MIDATRTTNTRFVVLTSNRTGSTWLMSTLNSHPQVMAQGELFLPRPRVAEKRWDSDFARPRYIETRFGRAAIRPFTVFTYLNDLYRTPGAVGFKLMYLQLARYPEILGYLLWRRIPVVHLVRRNHLDILVSYAVKAKIGRAHLLSGDKSPGNLAIELDTRTLIGKLKWLQKQQDYARRLLRLCRLRHMEIAYDDLVRNHARFETILAFLGIPPEAALESRLEKIRKGGHRDVIANYEAVKTTLSASEFAGLIQ